MVGKNIPLCLTEDAAVRLRAALQEYADATSRILELHAAMAAPKKQIKAAIATAKAAGVQRRWFVEAAKILSLEDEDETKPDEHATQFLACLVAGGARLQLDLFGAPVAPSASSAPKPASKPKRRKEPAPTVDADSVDSDTDRAADATSLLMLPTVHEEASPIAAFEPIDDAGIIYADGENAASCGQPEDVCPHADGTEKNVWLAGYRNRSGAGAAVEAVISDAA